jgi:F-type H+-transporting ATPase subunit epsilon
MTLTLEILVPDGLVVRTEAIAVRAVDATGSFGLLPGHEDFCASLVPSILIYRDIQGRVPSGYRYVAVDGGVLVLEDDRVSVVTRDAVPSDNMDSVAEAVASMLRSRRQQEQEASRAFRTLVGELLEQLPLLGGRK